VPFRAAPRSMVLMTGLRESLDSLYAAYNKRSYVHPDPLEFLYRYEDPRDVEVAGLISSCLAYGRVAQILASVGRVLDPMGDSPRRFLEKATARGIAARLAGFVHRFTRGAELSALLVGIKRTMASHGTLEKLFALGMDRRDETAIPALTAFVAGLRAAAGNACPSLLPSPADGSACKRLHLFLRWMARRDAVDPGPWKAVPPSRLVVPLDTHLFRICRGLGLTARRQADLKTALEITEGFRAIRPRDPVRYDFSLTRMGIRKDCLDNPIACLLEEKADG
jgi:uncharacterized protein (TIGR02757 family)